MSLNLVSTLSPIQKLKTPMYWTLLRGNQKLPFISIYKLYKKENLVESTLIIPEGPDLSITQLFLFSSKLSSSNCSRPSRSIVRYPNNFLWIENLIVWRSSSEEGIPYRILA